MAIPLDLSLEQAHLLRWALDREITELASDPQDWVLARRQCLVVLLAELEDAISAAEESEGE